MPPSMDVSGGLLSSETNLLARTSHAGVGKVSPQQVGNEGWSLGGIVKRFSDS